MSAFSWRQRQCCNLKNRSLDNTLTHRETSIIEKSMFCCLCDIQYVSNQDVGIYSTEKQEQKQLYADGSTCRDEMDIPNDRSYNHFVAQRSNAHCWKAKVVLFYLVCQSPRYDVQIVGKSDKMNSVLRALRVPSQSVAALKQRSQLRGGKHFFTLRL